MPRPSLVTSSGPSPVRGFIAAILHPLPAWGRMRPREAYAVVAGDCGGFGRFHSRVDQYIYYPEFRGWRETISRPARALTHCRDGQPSQQQPGRRTPGGSETESGTIGDESNSGEVLAWTAGSERRLRVPATKAMNARSALFDLYGDHLRSRGS